MADLCQHELPIDLLESLLLPRCQKCGRVMRDVQRAITDQYEREQREQAKPAPARAGRVEKPPPPGAPPEEVRRYQRHQRMRQRGDGDRIGYRGG